MIDEKIKELHNKHGTIDPYLLTEKIKIDILNLPLDDKTFGLTVRNNRHSTIILNSFIDDNLREFVLCHEIGHNVLHKSYNTPFMRHMKSNSLVSKIEAEAHRFAFEMLKSNYEELSYMTDYDIVDYYGLPTRMVEYIN